MSSSSESTTTQNWSDLGFGYQKTPFRFHAEELAEGRSLSAPVAERHDEVEKPALAVLLLKVAQLWQQ